jgi:hypothetical protein
MNEAVDHRKFGQSIVRNCPLNSSLVYTVVPSRMTKQISQATSTYVFIAWS